MMVLEELRLGVGGDYTKLRPRIGPGKNQKICWIEIARRPFALDGQGLLPATDPNEIDFVSLFITPVSQVGRLQVRRQLIQDIVFPRSRRTPVWRSTTSNSFRCEVHDRLCPLMKAFTWGRSLVGVVLSLTMTARADEPKNHDFDVIREEAKVPSYQLPPLLLSSEGKPITTPEEWLDLRRPQIMALFGNLVYGVVPAPESPIQTTFEVVKTDREFMGGQATRKDVRIRFENAKGSAEMRILVFTPNQADRPAPAFLLHSFASTQDDGHDAESEPPRVPAQRHSARRVPRARVRVRRRVSGRPGAAQRGRVPAWHSPAVLPRGTEFSQGQRMGRDRRRGLGRVPGAGLPRNGPGHRLLAHCRHGPFQDGQGRAVDGGSGSTVRPGNLRAIRVRGAALWRRKYGETMEKMVTRFPYWLCRNAWKFANHEDHLPVDQHMLIACIAPRPVYVASGVEDLWADPRGEYLSAYHASAVYRLLGKQGLTDEASPPVGQALVESEVGYHNRAGGHSVERFDWLKFLEFAEYHLQPR